MQNVNDRTKDSHRFCACGAYSLALCVRNATMNNRRLAQRMFIDAAPHCCFTRAFAAATEPLRWINNALSPLIFVSAQQPTPTMSNGQVPLATTYPPDVGCFQNSTSNEPWTILYEENNCSVTNNMLNFLNLTEDYKQYISVYCLNPPTDDDCPFGFCPNPDVSGPLVRVASELTQAFHVLEPYH